MEKYQTGLKLGIEVILHYPVWTLLHFSCDVPIQPASIVLSRITIQGPGPTLFEGQAALLNVHRVGMSGTITNLR